MRSTPEPRSSRVWLAFRRPSAEQSEPATESPVRSLQTAFLSGLGGASGYAAALAAFNPGPGR